MADQDSKSVRGRRIDLTGQTFGLLTVIEYAGKSFWRCSCACGGSKDAYSGSIRKGLTRSCGCLPRRVKEPDAPFNHPLYKIWEGMKTRCMNPRHADYKNYGGRGIKVCADWIADIKAFAAYMGARPSPKHSVDRIDNNGDYAPGNVRWATNTEQCANKRNNRILFWRGDRYTLSQLARKIASECQANPDHLRSELRRFLEKEQK